MLSRFKCLHRDHHPDHWQHLRSVDALGRKPQKPPVRIVFHDFVGQESFAKLRRIQQSVESKMKLELLEICDSNQTHGHERWLTCLDESRFGAYSLNFPRVVLCSPASKAYTAIITLIIGNISDPSMPWAENRRNHPSGSFVTTLLDKRVLQNFAEFNRVLSPKWGWNY